MNIVVKADLFAAVAPFVSKEETRYQLNGVYVEPHPVEGALIIATDGRRLMVAHDAEGKCDEPAIIKLPGYLLAQCWSPKSAALPRRLEFTDAEATVSDVAPAEEPEGEPVLSHVITAPFIAIDGTFPDWRRVIPASKLKVTELTPAAFNAAYLKDWAVVSQKLAKSLGGSTGILVGQSDGASPTLIRFEGRENVFGVLMPMRVGVGDVLPAFMAEPEPQAVAAE